MNPRVREISGSLIRELASRKRPNSIDLGLGEPTLRPRQDYFVAALEHVARHGIRYTANAGDPELRAAIAGHYAYPSKEKAHNVCVTVGSQEAMYVAIKTLLDPSRDELLVVEPAFPSYAKMAALEGIMVRSVAMSPDDGFAFDGERILSAVTHATRAIVLCSPCNPTARVLTCEGAETLASGLERRSGPAVWLIHDEIYREQTFVSNAAHCAARYPNTIVTNSLSKSNAMTGLRLGWILAAADFITEAIKVHAWLTSCADTFAQRVALQVFHTPGGVREHAAWYRRRRDEVVAGLERLGLRFVAPDGSFYVCVKLADGSDSIAAAHELVDRYDVVTIPGAAFGPSLEGWLRLSWVAPADQVRSGIERVARYCASLAVLP